MPSAATKQMFQSALHFTVEQFAIRRRLYERWSDVYRFMAVVREWGIEDRIDVLYNARADEFHLTDCIWSREEAKCGPDTCFCHHHMKNPQRYLGEKYGLKDPEEIPPEEKRYEELHDYRKTVFKN